MAVSDPYYADDRATIWEGDCLAVLRGLPDNSVDAIVTDPPAGIGFMGRSWDHHKGGREQWSAWLAEVMREALRVAKPGAHALVWAIPRTSHWTACGLEDAGWEIRDRLVHLFGTGFPKSLDVSKAIDRARDDRPDILRVTSWLKAQSAARGFTRSEVDQHMGTTDMAGWWLTDLPHRCQCPTWEQWAILKRFMGLPDDMDAEVWRLNGRKGTPGEAWGLREVTGSREVPAGHAFAGPTYGGDSSGQLINDTAPATDAARQWQGWGTALKPAAEDWWLARNPLQGTVAGNVQAWGTGGLNIDGCRIGTTVETWPKSRQYVSGNRLRGLGGSQYEAETHQTGEPPAGRWPANVTLDEAAAQALDQQSGELATTAPSERTGLGGRSGGIMGDAVERVGPKIGHDDSGGASRFFYTAKAGSDERITYTEPMCVCGHSRSQHANDEWGSCLIPDCWCPGFAIDRSTVKTTSHPTVKPLSLMRWLVRLVTPPGGLVLDMFAGSGATVEAALLEGFRCIAIEREPDYLPLITQRIHRRRDPIAYLTQGGHDLGLFGDEDGAA